MQSLNIESISVSATNHIIAIQKQIMSIVLSNGAIIYGGAIVDTIIRANQDKSRVSKQISVIITSQSNMSSIQSAFDTEGLSVTAVQSSLSAELQQNGFDACFKWIISIKHRATNKFFFGSEDSGIALDILFGTDVTQCLMWLAESCDFQCNSTYIKGNLSQYPIPGYVDFDLDYPFEIQEDEVEKHKIITAYLQVYKQILDKTAIISKNTISGPNNSKIRFSWDNIEIMIDKGFQIQGNHLTIKRPDIANQEIECIICQQLYCNRKIFVNHQKCNCIAHLTCMKKHLEVSNHPGLCLMCKVSIFEDPLFKAICDADLERLRENDIQ